MDKLWLLGTRTIRVLKVLPRIAFLTIRNLFGRESVVGSAPVIVSLTTYSSRSKQVHLAIESIAAGSCRPERIILWIDDEKILARLPKGLRRLQARGLEILATPNYGPHKKYYSFLEHEDHLDLPLVTADDDIIYPKSWLEDLLRSYAAFPQVISCFRAHRVTLCEGRIAPYKSWKPCLSQDPSFLSFSTGASGALYPPDFLKVLKTLGSEFVHVAPKADDVWLHGMAVKHGVMTRQINDYPVEYPVIPGSQQFALSHQNVSLDGNDTQIQLTYGLGQLRTLQAEVTVGHARH